MMRKSRGVTCNISNFTIASSTGEPTPCAFAKSPKRAAKRKKLLHRAAFKFEPAIVTFPRSCFHEKSKIVIRYAGNVAVIRQSADETVLACWERYRVKENKLSYTYPRPLFICD